MVAVAVTHFDADDEEQPALDVYAHSDDQIDAQLVADWLRDDALFTYLQGVSQLLMTRLYVNAVANNPTGKPSECTVTLGLSQSRRD